MPAEKVSPSELESQAFSPQLGWLVDSTEKLIQLINDKGQIPDCYKTTLFTNADAAQFLDQLGEQSPPQIFQNYLDLGLSLLNLDEALRCVASCFLDPSFHLQLYGKEMLDLIDWLDAAQFELSSLMEQVLIILEYICHGYRVFLGDETLATDSFSTISTICDNPWFLINPQFVARLIKTA